MKFRPKFESVKSFKLNFFDEFQLVTSVLDAIENNEPIASDGGEKFGAQIY